MKATAYWLMPSHNYLDKLQGVVDELAIKFDAGRFEPHLTLHYHLGLPEKSLQEILSDAAKDVSIFTSEVVSLECTDIFTQTFFLQFKTDDNLDLLVKNLSASSGFECERAFDPHIGLLYQSLSEDQRTELLQSYNSLIEPIEFSAIKAIECILPVSTKEDVEGWKTLASIGL